MDKKRNLLFLISFFMFLMPMWAQNLLYEDFNSGTFPPSGWTVIEEPSAGQHWRLTGASTPIEGEFSLYHDEKASSESKDYNPVMEEYVITPAVTLPADEPYGVRFFWKSNSIYMLDKGAYEFRVAVSEDNGNTWNVIWSAVDKDQVEASGVIFPWSNWSENYSTVSLDDYKGKTIKIGFIYKLIDPANGNALWLDLVSVLPHTPITGPVVTGTNAYKFGETYVGVKQKSPEPLYLTNEGIGQLEITAIEGLEGTDYSTDLEVGLTSLTAQRTGAYYVYYTPTLTGARDATMTIKTNGGDHVVNLTGTKIALQDGYTLESFETIEFPPLGWTNSGWTISTSTAASGDKSATAHFQNLATLTSPRLELTSGNYNLTFDYYLFFDEYSEYPPDDKIYVEVSKDGGSTWTTLWTFDEEFTNGFIRKNLQLNNMQSDNCYVRFTYKIDGQLSYDMACREIYLDNVVLPPLYGANMKPEATSNPTPANGAINQYVNELKLGWRGSLHATGYRLYVGTNQSNPNSILDGVEIPVGQNTYEVSGLDYNSTYYWKVVAYNAQGEADNTTTWSFTTMQDMSISTFPYFQGFEDGEVPPVGWISTYSEGQRGWTLYGNGNAYSGNYCAGVFGSANNTYAILQMPEVFLPDDQEMQITFMWGNNIPAGLTRAETRTGADTIYFEVRTPDTEWEVKALCSQNGNSGEHVWVRQKVLLGDYKGQRVSMRWRYSCTNSSSRDGGALDDIRILVVSDAGVPEITFKEWYSGQDYIRTEWDAGIINYKEARSPGEIFFLENQGEYDLEIETIGFDTDYFLASLNPGTIIHPNDTAFFAITFRNPNNPNGEEQISDNLKIKFVDGQTYQFPVKGKAMGEFSYCFTFEEDAAFTTNNINGFRTVDEDGLATISFEGLFFPGKGSAFAFMVIDWEKADWRNVYPVSGSKIVMAAGEASYKNLAKDWLITSETYNPQPNAQLRFFARNYATDLTLWDASTLSVLVSTTDNNISSFSPTSFYKEKLVPGDYTEYTVDLSQYQGQNIYVAFYHEVENGLAMFMDDIYFENFILPTPGNRPPYFTTFPGTKVGIEIDKLYTYNFQVIDPEGEDVTINIKVKPEWLEYIPGQSGGMLTGIPTETGDFRVLIEATDGEHTVSQDFTLEVGDVGIAGQNANEFKVYPNPVTSVLKIDGNYTGIVTITDLTGKVVFTGRDVNEVNVDNLNAGIYILKINSDSGIYTTRIIKK